MSLVPISIRVTRQGAGYCARATDKDGESDPFYGASPDEALGYLIREWMNSSDAVLIENIDSDLETEDSSSLGGDSECDACGSYPALHWLPDGIKLCDVCFGEAEVQDALDDKPQDANQTDTAGTA